MLLCLAGWPMDGVLSMAVLVGTMEAGAAAPDGGGGTDIGVGDNRASCRFGGGMAAGEN
jgi:hypothetical protein